MNRVLYPNRIVVFSMGILLMISHIVLKNNDMYSLTAGLLMFLFSLYWIAVVILQGPEMISDIRANKVTKMTKAVVKLWWKDVFFKNQVFVFCSAVVDVVYAFLKMGQGIYYKSTWSIILSLYYLLLACMFVYLCNYTVHNDFGDEIRSERRLAYQYGIILLYANIFVGLMMIFMVNQNPIENYPVVLFYLSAAYTIYKLSYGIYSYYHFRKYNSPLLNVVRQIYLITALVTLFSLQITLFAQFNTLFGYCANCLSAIIAIMTNWKMSVRLIHDNRNS